MKLSILTATYNRGNLLGNLYKSIVDNLYDKLDIEWLIMDDGSTDNTEEVVGKFKNMEHLEIRYFKQENQGKMQAINNLMEYVSGELVMDCDSDDYLIEGSLKKIECHSRELLEDDNLYALAFLRSSEYKNIRGKRFENTAKKTTMFNLYFRENMDGEKVLVFKKDIRKLYKHELECGEKFITEARLYYKIEDKYEIKCYNEEILSGNYLEEGYTNNSIRLFINNPNGFFKYFQEILARDTKGVKLNKRLYIVKHYILFTVLCKKKITIKNIKNIFDKILILILYLPGIVKSKIFISKNKQN